jgi:hypothetical protein
MGFQTSQANPCGDQLHLVPRTARVVEVVNLGALAACYGEGAEATEGKVRDGLQGWFVDVSQNPGRRPWSRGALPSLCRNTTIYAYGPARGLTVRELARALGWGDALDLDSITAAEMRDLLGESMALPSQAVAIWALFSSVAESLPDLFAAV